MATKQASSVEEIASNIEEMNASITFSQEKAEQSSNFLKNSEESISNEQSMVNKTVEYMEKIVSKVALIDRITAQTNLLSINASIEATNAGEFGKGFSVVANAVRELAQKSKDSALEIEELTNLTLEHTSITKSNFDKIMPGMSKSVALSNEISNASKEQKMGSDQINQAVSEYNKDAQQLALTSEELTLSSTQLAQKANSMKSILVQFRT